jgi:hypothetical protein
LEDEGHSTQGGENAEHVADHCGKRHQQGAEDQDQQEQAEDVDDRQVEREGGREFGRIADNERGLSGDVRVEAMCSGPSPWGFLTQALPEGPRPRPDRPSAMCRLGFSAQPGNIDVWPDPVAASLTCTSALKSLNEITS